MSWLSIFSRKSSAASGPRTVLSESLRSSTLQTNLAPVRQTLVSRPPLEKYYVHGLIALSALMTADLTIMYFRDKMIPTSAPPARPSPPIQQISTMRNQYDIIARRNIFNSDGLIPAALSQPETIDGEKGFEGPASPTSLPIQLIGTIVHKNPAKSVATLEVRGGKILPFVPNDDMEGLGVLLRVERKRAIFRNNQNGRNEYIDIKDKSAIQFGLRSERGSEAPAAEQKDFSVPRTEVNNYIRNLPELLQQARAEPNILPGGKIDGFKVLDIMPGSIYEKLGIRVGDVIKGANGIQIDSPAKAMELYQQLRNSNRITIDVERNGSKETLTYTIN